MSKYLVTILLCCIAPLTLGASEKQSIIIEYDKNTEYEDIRLILIEDGALDGGIDFVNQMITLDDPIVVRIGDLDGPLYDPGTGDIQFPYGFYTEVVNRFEQIEEDDEALSTLAGDAMLHTLFHELAHALIDQLELPIVGREEDAADALASVLLLEYYDAGAEIAANAAELFALEGEDRGELEKEDFWGEHSLDEQRYYATLCHIYGSNPEEFTDLAEDVGFSVERREICTESYHRLVDDWSVLLEPVLRSDSVTAE